MGGSPKAPNLGASGMAQAMTNSPGFHLEARYLPSSSMGSINIHLGCKILIMKWDHLPRTRSLPCRSAPACFTNRCEFTWRRGQQPLHDPNGDYPHAHQFTLYATVVSF